MGNQCVDDLAYVLRLIASGNPIAASIVEAGHRTAAAYGREPFLAQLQEFWHALMMRTEHAAKVILEAEGCARVAPVSRHASAYTNDSLIMSTKRNRRIPLSSEGDSPLRS
jgi:hypothetical protein